ncbi:hypothetical protein KJ903_01540 [Patescibacteria group bacterium]|nr:hypothetical protein [Patescibacteria group bacterium]
MKRDERFKARTDAGVITFYEDLRMLGALLIYGGLDRGFVLKVVMFLLTEFRITFGELAEVSEEFRIGEDEEPESARETAEVRTVHMGDTAPYPPAGVEAAAEGDADGGPIAKVPTQPLPDELDGAGEQDTPPAGMKQCVHCHEYKIPADKSTVVCSGCEEKLKAEFDGDDDEDEDNEPEVGDAPPEAIVTSPPPAEAATELGAEDDDDDEEGSPVATPPAELEPAVTDEDAGLEPPEEIVVADADEPEGTYDPVAQKGPGGGTGC